MAPLITRHPTQAQIAAACMKPLLQGENCNQPVDVILGRWHNLASLKTRGVDNPPSLRLVGTLAWSRGRWTIKCALNHTGGYRDVASVPARSVDSWTTFDINVGYQIEGSSGRFAHRQINLGINNAIDQRPPSSTSLTLAWAGWVRPGKCQPAGQASQPAVY